MNQYFSRGFSASASIASMDIGTPGAGVELNLTAVELVPYPAIFTLPYASMNAQSLIRVLRIGLFSNFADGLVLNSAKASNIDIVISEAMCESDAAWANDVAMTRGSRTLTGTGLGSLAVGDVILLGSPADWAARVQTIVDPTTVTVDNPGYWTGSFSAAANEVRVFTPDSSTGQTRTVYNLRTMNAMYDCEFIVSAAAYAGIISDYTYGFIPGLFGTVLVPLDMLLTSVSPDFDSETVDFTLLAECEVTF